MEAVCLAIGGVPAHIASLDGVEPPPSTFTIDGFEREPIGAANALHSTPTYLQASPSTGPRRVRLRVRLRGDLTFLVSGPG